MAWKDPEKKKAYDKAYRKKNKEKRKAYDKAYREENKERMKARDKAYREENKEKTKASSKAYREKNKEKIKARKKAYREEKKEEIKAYQKAYRKKNKEKIKVGKKAYSEANKDRYSAYSAKRKALKILALLPTTDNELVKKLYKQRAEMSEKRGEEYHVDHIIPLSIGGAHHQDNMRVITAKENLEKNDKYTPELGGVWADNDLARKTKKKLGIK
jgi:5-methylcytosine-specific restriction endonuclease McrA